MRLIRRSYKNRIDNSITVIKVICVYSAQFAPAAQYRISPTSERQSISFTWRELKSLQKSQISDSQISESIHSECHSRVPHVLVSICFI